ncbi:ArgE/DapE family deacylase [Halobaculum sp. EA56]|uniref:ArgE/DapE family deacylase n=1 Tax=Halobaculum sp. EA56 TaxID=3421648 RepID=UPI003EB7C327
MELRESDLRETAAELVSYRSLPGEETAAQSWLRDRLDDLGFRTYEWEPDADALDAHPSFPPAADLDLAGRPSVAGVLELGDPDAGPTVVLNGHVDVVPAEEADWTGDPFAPRFEDGRLYGRGAADMKGGLAACVYAALALAESGADLDGRVVVESVVGEEEGGVGAATAAATAPYPFERDAALVAEPTAFDVVLAAEGSLMARLELVGAAAHAARAWEGESVLPHFERIRRAFKELERERAESVTHPLFEEYDTPWPVNVGTVEAGSWASSVPAHLASEVRIGVAPHESVAEVEAAFRRRLDEVVADSEWLREHPPTFERFSVQFEGSEVGRDEPIVTALADAIATRGRSAPRYRGFTAGTDARHYIGAGIPTVVFGPGSPERAHGPDEYVEWEAVVEGCAVIAEAARGFLREN